ncbi:zinc ribbon domain-containing protein [Mucilaginibacter sp. dw_454]|uniref:zinc ribbon domain-containing protein n=1 Tax=Mucilaginibacter sp. dw_454 TaxID=2720079 RepID=UPI001BD41F70|nr:zinc ribbon domain-containing protein [Mucilaginibacter sp. dw_454]
MDASPSITVAPNVCAVCSKNVDINDSFCDNCGYPLKGSEMDQQTFVVTRNNHEIDLNESLKKVKMASNTLYWIAGATALFGIFSYFITDDPATKISLLIVNFILAAVYLGLGIWSKKKPFAGIVSGFSLYILVIILNTINDPATIAKGLFIKIIFIGYFIKGIKSALEAERIKKELNIE